MSCRKTGKAAWPTGGLFLDDLMGDRAPAEASMRGEGLL
jgi:hypothetical protein